MSDDQTPKKPNDEFANENMQKRVNSLFSGNELPAYESMREVDAMKSRIRELETKLLTLSNKSHRQEMLDATIDAISQEDMSPSSKSESEVSSQKEIGQSKLGFLAKFFRAPTFGDLSKNRVANLQHKILVGLISTSLIALIILLLTWSATSTATSFIIVFTSLALYVVAFVWLYQGRLQLVSWLLVALFYSIIVTTQLTGTFSQTTVLIVTIVIAMAGILLKPFQVIAVTTLTVITSIFFAATNSDIPLAQTTLIFMGVLFALEGLLLTFGAGAIEQSFVDVDHSTKALVNSNSQLKDLTQNLELRVAERTHDLELATEVGRAISEKIGNLQDLFTESVELIRSSYKLYYTQLYLLDASGRNLVLRAGTGEAGKQLLQRGHRLAVSANSLNSRAVSTEEPILVEDTKKNTNFLPNPLLPHTRSELSVPLIFNGKVIGVLDMQSDKPETFSEANIPAFEVLTGQLAIAIQNSILFNQTEESRLLVQEQAHRLTSSGWHEFLNAIDRSESLGYVLNQEEVLPITETQETPFENKLVVPIQVTGTDVGEIQLEGEANRQWSSNEAEIVQAAMEQVGQHIENLRLLSQAEQFRAEAEQISRRLTNEGWEEFVHTRKELADGYIYTKNQVQPLNGHANDTSSSVLSYPLVVRDEPIGKLELAAGNGNEPHTQELVSAVVEKLSNHIESLRLLEQTELSRVDVQKSQQRFELAVRGSDDGVWDWNITEDTIYYSPRWKSMLGFEEHELTRGFTEWEERIHPEDKDRATKALEDYLAQKSPEYDVELRLKHKDGHYVWIRDRGKALRREDGTAYRMAGAHTDVSERKRNEDLIAQRATQLEEAQTFLDSVIENLPNMLFVKDAEDLRFVRWNKAAEQITGFDRNTLLSKNDYDFFPKEEADSFTSHDRQVLLSGQALDIPEEPLATAHRGIRYMHTRKVPIYSSDGKAKYLLGVSEDITERKHDQEILAQRANQLETVATVSTTASTVLNPDLLLQQVVNLTKSRFDLYHAHVYLLDENWNTLLLAAGAGEVGTKMVEEGHAIDFNAERSLVARAAREKQAVIINDVHTEVGFLPNPLLPNTRAELAIPMIVGETVLGVFDVQSDSADAFSKEDASIYSTLASQIAVALQNARLYQEQSATVTQLRELDRLKSSFLANMSHELRTPLNSILGFTEVMLEGLDGPLTSNMDNDLKLISKNGQHLLHLINDVLDMAKIESGKMNLIIEKFNLHEIFEEVVNITSPLASEKKLTLKIEAKSDHNAEINADRTRLRQVMINLVNNALKFTEKGKVTIRAIREENNILISVKDSGIGIPPAQLEDVFQEFTQVDSSTTRKSGGTGLGLPISRRLVEMHGGKLWAESTGVEGEGTTFFVFLPIENRSTVSEPVTKKID